MKFYLSLFLVFSVVLNVSCQPDTNFVPVAAYWNVGDIHDFSVIKVKRKWIGKTLAQDDSSNYNAHFLVIDADSSSYTIQWSLKNYLFDRLQLPDQSRLKLQKYDSIRVVYKTDQFGAFREIINWRDLSKMINEMTDELIQAIGETKAEAREVRKSLQPLISVFSTQRGMEQLVFNELLMMHFPYGKQYEKGKRYYYTEEIPIMVNSAPATGNGVIFIRHANADSQRCELVKQMRILPDSVRKFLVNYYTSIGIRPEAIASTVESSLVDVVEDDIYDYLYFPGTPLKVSVSRITRINVLEDRIKQIDITMIENTGFKSP